MDKLKMETNDLTEKNIEKIAALFPNVITEMKDENGKVKKAIKFELLKQELSRDVADTEECYDFTWAGKKAAILESNTPIRKTLRPCIEESKDWENTGNLYIEGDNLEVLKMLQESYLNSIKLIYIDPPYNTGNDFIYKDNFKIDKEEYEELIGLYDDEDNKLFRNTETNGRFHSDWCSMIYPRLKLAYNLLSEDGAIFISIDENEVENLKKICNEIFGEQNFVSCIVNVTGASQNGEGVKIQKNYENCLVYCKSQEIFMPNKVDKAAESLRSLSDAPTPLHTRPDMGYTIYFNPVTKDIIPVKDYDKEKIHLNEEELVYTDDKQLINSGYITIRPGKKSNLLHRWRWGFDTFLERKSEIVIKENSGKYFAYFMQSGYNPPKNVMNYTVGTSDVKNLFENNRVFDFPKSVNMLKYIINIATNRDSVILDFFSGSATTAHAVMELNAEDGGTRKFIMVQLPEKTDENSEAYKAGFKNICEIGKERIRRAGDKIKSKTKEGCKVPDIGFRVLKADSTNMKDVYYSANEYTQSILSDLESNIKEDRTDLDLLYGVLLDWGLTLSLKHKIQKIEGTVIHIVDEASLVVCFENNVSENAIRAIAKLNPLRAVFKDSSFAGSNDKINVEEIFKLLAPNTSIKVI